MDDRDDTADIEAVFLHGYWLTRHCQRYQLAHACGTDGLLSERNDAAEEVEGDLRSCPEEAHSSEDHEFAVKWHREAGEQIL